MADQEQHDILFGLFRPLPQLIEYYLLEKVFPPTLMHQVKDNDVLVFVCVELARA